MKVLEDKPHFRKKRSDMIDRLRMLGIRDDLVLTAMNRVPRHFFVSEAFVHEAYEEKALPIGQGQTISHPYTVARMTELLELSEHDKVLEIGTGSGYQTAVLCELGMNVYSVEIVRALANQAAELLTALNYRYVSHTGDGSKGWAGFAPYQAIIVTAGAPGIPDILTGQLEAGRGRLIIPVGNSNDQKLVIYHKKEDQPVVETLHDLRFVPLVGKYGWNQ